MNRARLMLLALVFLVAGPVYAQTSVAGDWNVTIQSAQGATDVQVTFKQEGDKVSGVFKSPMGEMPFDGGTITGSDLRFGFTIPIQGQSLEVTMTGKVDGPSITGKAVFGSFGEGDWTGKRVAGSTAASAAPAASSPAAAPAPTSATGFSGKWDLTIKTQMGDMPVSATISDAGGRVSGTLSGPQGDIDISGTVEGNALKLAFVARTPQGDIPISMTGDLDGDSIVNGKADFGGMGQGEWTGKRSKP
jgi:hypothetical protein